MMRPTAKSLRKHTPTKMVGNRNWNRRYPGRQAQAQGEEVTYISEMTKDDLRMLADSMSSLDTVNVVAPDHVARQFQLDLNRAKSAMKWGVVDR